MPHASRSGRRQAQIQIHTVHPYGKADEKRLQGVARRVLEQEGWGFKARVIIADDEELRRLHRLFLGVDETTDVITFPGDQEAPAEIYLSLDQAREQALEAGESIQRAVERLLIHGLLHLGGWKDDSEAERRKMLEHGEEHLLACEK
jgi:probable rRNA maturation factor